MDAPNGEKHQAAEGWPKAIRVAIGSAGLLVAMQLASKVLFFFATRFAGLKAGAAAVPVWQVIFGWVTLVGFAAGAYGIWTRRAAVRWPFSILLAVSVTIQAYLLWSLVANLARATSAPPTVVLSMTCGSLLPILLKLLVLLTINLPSSRQWLERGQR